MSDIDQLAYRPGVRGWWRFLRLADLLRDGDGVQWRTIMRRARPSSRLRQSETELRWWRLVNPECTHDPCTICHVPVAPENSGPHRLWHQEQIDIHAALVRGIRANSSR